MFDFKGELEKINISLTEEQNEQFEKYFNLLVKWNSVMNLTGITDYDGVYLKHFYDSLTLYKAYDFKKEIKLCDIGSGAGFPAIPLKIAFPNLDITIVDSLNKRIEFLNEVIKELNLKNIVAIHARAEELDKREYFDVVTSRALADVNIGLELCLPLVSVNGYYLPMVNNIDLGKNTIGLLGGKLENELNFTLPVENSNRKILVIKKIKETNKIYPRSFAQIKKKPLK